MIVLIAAVSVLVAFFATRAIIGDSATEEVTVPSIIEFSPELAPIDEAVFNANAINPAVEVQIDGESQ